MNDEPEAGDLDPRMLAHELRNTLAAIDMLLEHAENQAEEGESPLGSIAKARAGVAETVEIIATHLERR